MTGTSANPRVRVVTIDPSDGKDNAIATPPVVTIERIASNGVVGRFRATAADCIVEFTHLDGWSFSLLSEAFAVLAFAERAHNAQGGS